MHRVYELRKHPDKLMATGFRILALGLMFSIGGIFFLFVFISPFDLLLGGALMANGILRLNSLRLLMKTVDDLPAYVKREIKESRRIFDNFENFFTPDEMKKLRANVENIFQEFALFP